MSANRRVGIPRSPPVQQRQHIVDGERAVRGCGRQLPRRAQDLITGGHACSSQILRGAIAGEIDTLASEPARAGPDSELSHVCAGGDLDGELGIEGLGETVEHPKTRNGAASFKPSYG